MAKADLTAAIADATRNALVDVLRTRPNLTVDDLIDLRKEHGASLGKITLGELFGKQARRGGTPAAVHSDGPRRRKSQLIVGKMVDTRTPAGRAAYEQSILDHLKGSNGNVRAPAMRAAVGGTPAQARAALNRLIQSGQVGFSGQARATEYWAT